MPTPLVSDANQAILSRNLQVVRAHIDAAAKRAGREPSSVRLVAVTKKSPVEWIAPLVDLGVKDLGENYPQELWKKADQTASLDVRWHLIGHLQSNKLKRTYPLVKAIHSVDSLDLLELIDKAASTDPMPRRWSCSR